MVYQCERNFFQAYVECALWSSTKNDDVGTPLDREYTTNDFAPEALASMRVECDAFCDAHYDDIVTRDYARAGHDFWLTRNGHGAGFWDGDWPADVGARLTEAAHAFGESDVYVGDDGLLYVMGG